MSEKPETVNSPRPDPVQAQLDSINQITEHARKEIEWERKYFSLQLKCLTGIVVAGLITFGLLYWKDRADMRTQMKSDIEDYKTQVTNRINTQLDTDNVNSIISKGISEKVGKITDEYIANRLDIQINPKLKATTEEAEFARNMILASRYHRQAFDKLLEIANDGDNPRASEAAFILNEVSYSLINVFIEPTYDASKFGININNDSIEFIKDKFQTGAFPPQACPSILDAFWNSGHYTLYEKLDFLSWVIRNNSFMQGIHKACRLMDTEAHTAPEGTTPSLTRYPDFIKWWEQHKNDAKYHPEAASPSKTP